VGLAQMDRFRDNFSSAEIKTFATKSVATKQPESEPQQTPPQSPEQERRSFWSTDDRGEERHQAVQVESRAPPSPAHEPDFLDAAFETLEIGLCCAAATPATVV
jgi:hypothetical protein